MEIKACYEQFGGDYDGVLARMLSEERIMRFSQKFLKDDCYAKLTEAVENDRCEDAFRAAHTLKGICGNLGYTGMFQVLTRMCEELRGKTSFRDRERVLELTAQVTAEYDRIVTAIGQMELND